LVDSIWMLINGSARPVEGVSAIIVDLEFVVGALPLQSLRCAADYCERSAVCLRHPLRDNDIQDSVIEVNGACFIGQRCPYEIFAVVAPPIFELVAFRDTAAGARAYSRV
jgi:hypothetical protein